MLECQASGCRPSDISVKQAKQIEQLVKARAVQEDAEHTQDARGFKKPAYVSLRMVRRAAAERREAAERRAGAAM